MNKYIITKTDGSQFNVYNLEQNGINAAPTTRQILQVSLVGGAGFNSFTIAENVTYRFVVGFQFDVLNSNGFNGTYTVNNSSYDGTNTVISVVEVIPVAAIPFGNISYNIPDSEIATPLTLSGRGFINFGQSLIDNAVHTLENFSNNTPPLYPVVGQYWYNKDTDEMYRYDNNNQWTTSINLSSGSLTFIDPQHPTDTTTPTFKLTSDDDDVGVSLKTITDPNVGDSLFRVVSSDLTERLRVEYVGHVSTTNAFKTTSTTHLNEFSNDITFPSQKGIISTNGAILRTDTSGNTWIAESGNPAIAYSLIATDSLGNILLGVRPQTNAVEVWQDLRVDTTNNLLFADVSAQTVGILNSSPGESLDVTGNIRSSGQIKLSNGTLLLPSLTFDSNNSVGLRINGVDNIGFVANGTEIVVVKSSGVVSVVNSTYENLVIDDNDVPNKKYVDDLLASTISSHDELGELVDVTLTNVGEDDLLAYDLTSGLWINQTSDEANVVSKDGTTMNVGANITFNAGEILGLPSAPSSADAATSYEFTEFTYMKKFTNLPVDKIGTLNYLPLNVTGSYDGAAVSHLGGMPYFLYEHDGAVVGIRSGHSGDELKQFLAYSLDGNIDNLILTDTEYRPVFLSQDEYVSSIWGTSSVPGKGFFAVIKDYTNNSIVKYYWVHTNGTMNPTAHTYVDLAPLSAILTSYGSMSVQYIYDHDIWIAMSYSHFYAYDNAFNLIMSQQIMSVNDPAYVVYPNDSFGNTHTITSVGYSGGANFLYYTYNTDKIRIAFRYGLWVSFTGAKSYTAGINLKLDYDVTGQTLIPVHSYPYTVDVKSFNIANYPQTYYGMYNFYRDKWVRLSETEFHGFQYENSGSYFNRRDTNTNYTWKELVDDYGISPSIWETYAKTYYPDDASLLGKELHRVMWISPTNTLAQAYSKSISETTSTMKIVVNTLLDYTATETLKDGTISLSPPVSTVLNAEPILDDISELGLLSTRATSTGEIKVTHFDEVALTFTSYDATNGILTNPSVLVTLPANYQTQIDTLMGTTVPELITFSTTQRTFMMYVTSNIFVVNYGYYDSSNTFSEVGYVILQLNSGIFTVVSGKHVYYTLNNANSTPYQYTSNYSVFEDDVNDIAYLATASMNILQPGGNSSYTKIIKLVNDGTVNNGTLSGVSVNPLNPASWHYTSISIHPHYGFVFSDSFNNSYSRCKMTHKIGTLSDGVDRIRETAEMYMNDTGTFSEYPYLLTIQTPKGFNIYHSSFPAFLNGTYYVVATGSTDLAAIYTSPENSIFYAYVEVIGGEAFLKYYDTDIVETESLIKIGTVTTSNSGILTVDVEKVARFDTNHSEYFSTPNSIPIAGEDGKIDASWLPDNTSNAKMFFFGFS